MTLKPTSNQGSGGGGSGTVTSVSSADTSVAVATGTTTPVLTVAPLNTIAANSAASGNVAMNSHKLTGLAAGSGAGDSLRYEQAIGSNVLAVSNLVAGTAGQVLGGTGPSYALPPGFEIGYDQITGTVNIGASITTIITGSAYVFDGAAVLMTWFAPQVNPPVANNASINFNLYEGSTDLGVLSAINQTLGSTDPEIYTASGMFRFTPSAGSHTYLLRAIATSTTGTPKVVAGAGGAGTNVPAFMRFTKV